MTTTHPFRMYTAAHAWVERQKFVYDASTDSWRNGYARATIGAGRRGWGVTVTWDFYDVEGEETRA